nr:MAG TPA: hypothetical protein [Caudoviricetes sp.]
MPYDRRRCAEPCKAAPSCQPAQSRAKHRLCSVRSRRVTPDHVLLRSRVDANAHACPYHATSAHLRAFEFA